MPHFTYKGRLFAGMAAFKAHATFGLWQASAVLGETGSEREAMGQFGRLDLARRPAARGRSSKAIVRRAADQAQEARSRGRRSRRSPSWRRPPELDAALDANPAARATFDDFPPSCRREYVQWVVEAKRPETRDKRIAQAVEWMAEGKRRHWKYENC